MKLFPSFSPILGLLNALKLDCIFQVDSVHDLYLQGERAAERPLYQEIDTEQDRYINHLLQVQGLMLDTA